MAEFVQKPVITEKSLRQAAKGWYTFAVAKSARKERIATEIGKQFSVKVIDVRTVAMHGKVRRSGRKQMLRQREDWKKAMVQLKKGQKIDVFEVTSEQEGAK